MNFDIMEARYVLFNIMKIHIVHVKDDNTNDNANRTAALLYRSYFARRRSVIPIYDLARKHGFKHRMQEGDNVAGVRRW